MMGHIRIHFIERAALNTAVDAVTSAGETDADVRAPPDGHRLQARHSPDGFAHPDQTYEYTIPTRPIYDLSVKCSKQQQNVGTHSMPRGAADHISGMLWRPCGGSTPDALWAYMSRRNWASTSWSFHCCCLAGGGTQADRRDCIVSRTSAAITFARGGAAPYPIGPVSALASHIVLGSLMVPTSDIQG